MRLDGKVVVVMNPLPHIAAQGEGGCSGWVIPLSTTAQVLLSKADPADSLKPALRKAAPVGLQTERHLDREHMRSFDLLWTKRMSGFLSINTWSRFAEDGVMQLGELRVHGLSRSREVWGGHPPDHHHHHQQQHTGWGSPRSFRPRAPRPRAWRCPVLWCWTLGTNAADCLQRRGLPARTQPCYLEPRDGSPRMKKPEVQRNLQEGP